MNTPYTRQFEPDPQNTCRHEDVAIEVLQNDWAPEESFHVLLLNIFCRRCGRDFRFTNEKTSIVKISPTREQLYVFGQFTRDSDAKEKPAHVPTLHQEALALLADIERLPGSKLQTAISIAASDLAKRLKERMDKPAPDVQAGIVEAARIGLDHGRTIRDQYERDIHALKSQVVLLQEANEGAIAREQSSRAVANLVRGERDNALKTLEVVRSNQIKLANQAEQLQSELTTATRERDIAIEQSSLHEKTIKDLEGRSLNVFKLRLDRGVPGDLTHEMGEAMDRAKTELQLATAHNGKLVEKLDQVTAERDALKAEFRTINEMAERIFNK